MSVTSAIHVGCKTLIDLIVNFSPEVSICIRGRHAVGKSEVTYQAALRIPTDFYMNPENLKRFNMETKSNHLPQDGLPVIERRLSQLTEGDLTGMPDLDPGRKSTVFKPCDWLIHACDFPVVLFLDERNRALEGVKQAVFQLMDSRCFYGHKLHPETRVIVAENVGDIYNVQQNDPAEVSRAATVELDPEVGEWLEYAAQPGRCHDLTVSFVRSNPSCLEYDYNGNADKKKAFEPNKKYPDRRSWFKLDKELQRLGLMEQPSHPLFYVMTSSMVGIEVAHMFVDFAKNYDFQISVQEMLTDWQSAKKKLGNRATSAKYIELSSKLTTHCANIKISLKEAEQIGLFMQDCPVEPRMVTWYGMQKVQNNLIRVHKFVEKLMLETAQGIEEEGESPSEEAKNASSTTSAQTPPAATPSIKSK